MSAGQITPIKIEIYKKAFCSNLAEALCKLKVSMNTMLQIEDQQGERIDQVQQ